MWANLHQDPSSHLLSPGIVFLSKDVPQCIYIPCSHARYVLLNLCILRANTTLQPAPSQNAARNIMRVAGFCIVLMSDTNGRPPEIMLSGGSEGGMTQPIRSFLH